jgi:Cof subfamily protein (haloacid dehalogenase superfamily)
MSQLAREAGLRLPFGGFNGGSLALPDQSLVETHRLDEAVARRTLSLLAERGIEAWVFADGDWLLLHPYGPEVAREAHTVGFQPTVVDGFDAVIGRIDKIVGVSSDFAALDGVELEAKAKIGGGATIIRSNPAYLDVTHPLANKGDGVEALCRQIGVAPDHTAVIGDMFNDIAMFERAGFSIAMGQAPVEVKTRANAVTGANTEDGFALAMERFVLDRGDR